MACPSSEASKLWYSLSLRSEILHQLPNAGLKCTQCNIPVWAELLVACDEWVSVTKSHGHVSPEL